MQKVQNMLNNKISIHIYLIISILFNNHSIYATTDNMTSLAAGALFTTVILGNKLLQHRNSFQEKSSKKITNEIITKVQQDLQQTITSNSKPRKVVTCQDIKEMLKLQMQRNRERKQGRNLQNFNVTFKEQCPIHRKTLKKIALDNNFSYAVSVSQGQKLPRRIKIKKHWYTINNNQKNNQEQIAWYDWIANRVNLLEQDIETIKNSLNIAPEEELDDNSSEGSYTALSDNDDQWRRTQLFTIQEEEEEEEEPESQIDLRPLNKKLTQIEKQQEELNRNQEDIFTKTNQIIKNLDSLGQFISDIYRAERCS